MLLHLSNVPRLPGCVCNRWRRVRLAKSLKMLDRRCYAIVTLWLFISNENVFLFSPWRCVSFLFLFFLNRTRIIFSLVSKIKIETRAIVRSSSLKFDGPIADHFLAIRANVGSFAYRLFVFLIYCFIYITDFLTFITRLFSLSLYFCLFLFTQIFLFAFFVRAICLPFYVFALRLMLSRRILLW